MQVLLYPLRRLERFPMLPLPEAESLLGCGFLTVLPEQSRQEGLAALNLIDRLLLQHGGCRYPGDYFHLGRERWRSHLGGGWDEFQRMKQANDPAGILNPQISTHQQDQQETRAMR
jgi:hypothetical protein